MQRYEYRAAANLVSTVDGLRSRVGVERSIKGNWNERDAVAHCRLDARDWFADVYSLYTIESLDVKIIDDF